MLIPQAVRAMLPTIISQLVVTLKDTSLGYIILYPELLQTARLIASNTQVNSQYPYVSTIAVIGTIYVAMCLLLSALATWIEKRGRRAKTGIAMAAAAETPGILPAGSLAAPMPRTARQAGPSRPRGPARPTDGAGGRTSRERTRRPPSPPS